MEDLEENLRRPFSFYDVLECQSGAWVKVQDLLTGERFTVIEKMGSKSMKAGDMLYGKVVTVRDISMFDGLAEFLMPPQMKIYVIEERENFQKQQAQITPEWLRECDAELREIFWEFHEAIFNPPPPILTNTDGDIMVPHKMTFAIVDFQKTFEALCGLCFAESKEQILERADYDKKGKLKFVEFPWLQKGNKKHAAWKIRSLAIFGWNRTRW